MPSSFTNGNRSRIQRAPLARSSSLLGTIKNIVTAPLSWFGNTDEFENIDGKRKLTSLPITPDVQLEEGGPRSVKRQRRHSPEPLPPSQQRSGGYLDPASSMLVPPPSAYSGHSQSSLAVPSTSKQQRQARRSHSPYPTTSYAPTNGIPRTQSMDPPYRRTGSYEPSLTPIPLSRDASMEAPPSSSPPQEGSLSPSRTRFRMRTSLTPQPSGQSFGPAPIRRERDASEPPPLTSLSSNPVFVKAPAQSQSQVRSLSREPSSTLGSLVEARRAVRWSSHPRGIRKLMVSQSVPLGRQHSTLHIGTNATPDGPSTSELSFLSFSRPFLIRVLTHTGALRPINAAEKALQELEVYRTPLLPSRLKGSTTIPDMFKPKRIHAPVLMRDDRDERPRLGTAEKPGAKRKGKEDAKGSKPYSGQGGMKKLLARRKMEEEEEKEKERETEIDVEEPDSPIKSADKQTKDVKQKEAEPVLSTQPAAESPPSSIGGRPQSSLRVGRTRTMRTHAPAVQSRSRNKFSAIYEEDGDDQMLGDDEATVNQVPESTSQAPLFKPPTGFSFAKDVSAAHAVAVLCSDQGDEQTAPIVHDASTAKEPPIAALPFSIKPVTPVDPLKPTVEAGSQGQTQSFFSKPIPAVTSTSGAQTAAPIPFIALVPPSPGQPSITSSPKAPQPQVAEGESKTGSSVPKFFANSAYLKKSTVQLPATFSLVPPSANTEKAPEEKAVAPQIPSIITTGPSQGESSKVLDGAVEKTAEATKEASRPNLFGAAPPTFFSAAQPASTPSLFAAPAAKAPVADTPTPVAPTATPAFSFAPPAAKAEEKPVTSSPFSFAQPPAKVEEKPATSSPFSFAAPQKPAEKPATPSTPFSFGTPSKPAEPAVSSSPFAFGAPKTDSVKEGESRPTSDTSKPSPLFGAAPSTQSPFSFGPPVASPVEAPKSAFSFGTPPATASSTTPAVEAPKSLFAPSPPSSAFSFGPAATPSTTEAPAASKSPFSFSSKPSTPTTPAPEKTPFSFGGTSSPAPAGGSVLFATPASGSNGADVSSKPFSFGTTSTANVPRAATPPKGDTEVLMDESPVRSTGMDLNGNSKLPETPKTSPFSFGPSSTTGTSSPFGFGSSSSTSGPFGGSTQTKEAQAQKPASTFSAFGQTSSSPFGFGQKAAAETTKPTASPFSFGAPSVTPTSTTSPFSFNAPSSTGSGFNQPASASGSTPASPLAFNQATPFSFGTPSTGATTTNASSSAFNFGGSQPASPATPSTALPQASSPFTFGAAANVTSSSSSLFGATAAPSTGPPLFTMGSTPPAMTGMGGRPLKKLPSRRAGKR